MSSFWIPAVVPIYFSAFIVHLFPLLLSFYSIHPKAGFPAFECFTFRTQFVSSYRMVKTRWCLKKQDGWLSLDRCMYKGHKNIFLMPKRSRLVLPFETRTNSKARFESKNPKAGHGSAFGCLLYLHFSLFEKTEPNWKKNTSIELLAHDNPYP